MCRSCFMERAQLCILSSEAAARTGAWLQEQYKQPPVCSAGGPLAPIAKPTVPAKRFFPPLRTREAGNTPNEPCALGMVQSAMRPLAHSWTPARAFLSGDLGGAQSWVEGHTGHNSCSPRSLTGWVWPPPIAASEPAVTSPQGWEKGLMRGHLRKLAPYFKIKLLF